jgi:chromosomal replication initiation ATPase DnaA
MCLARWIVSFLAKEYTMNTSTRIGHLINRDHTSVLYGVAKVQGYVNVGDQKVIKLISSITTLLMPDGRNHLQEIINKIQEREQ